jgi:hypothetical protein
MVPDMASLPFVVQPRRKPIAEKIGTEESGIIEVERRGYLTTGEKAFVQQVQQFDNGTSEIITVSRQVARKYSLGMDKAYNLVLAIISGTNCNKEDEGFIAVIEEDFAENLTAVVRSLSAGQTREELIMAACLLRYRVDPEFEISEINKVHPDIINGLAALYRDEEKRSLEAFKNDEEREGERQESVEEIEKKPVKATKSRSTNTTGD